MQSPELESATGAASSIGARVGDFPLLARSEIGTGAVADALQEPVSRDKNPGLETQRLQLAADVRTWVADAFEDLDAVREFKFRLEQAYIHGLGDSGALMTPALERLLTEARFVAALVEFLEAQGD